MEDFKKIVKMKTGGSVKSAYCGGGYIKKKAGGEVHDAAEIKQDKAIVKKAIAMHDKQEHAGEKTDLSKLKRGGRSKKAVGTVKKYKEGGSTGVMETIKNVGKRLYENVMGTPEQNAEAQARLDKYEASKKAEAESAPVKKKCGGKIKKMAFGGLSAQAAPQAQTAIDSKAPLVSTMGSPDVARTMPPTSNAGGATRGLDRAAAMSGRTMPTTGRPLKKGGKC